jgi:hypothetical protein
MKKAGRSPPLSAHSVVDEQHDDDDQPDGDTEQPEQNSGTKIAHIRSSSVAAEDCGEFSAFVAVAATLHGGPVGADRAEQ